MSSVERSEIGSARATHHSIGRTLSLLLTGAAFGALACYFLDAANGKRRRALVRDKSTKLARSAWQTEQRLWRDINNRLHGLRARKRASQGLESVDDITLERRIRSEFGRKVKHARSIETKVNDGVVTLYGPVLASEVRALISCVENVPGVRGVLNHLDAHSQAENIPGLQGEGKRYLN